MKIYSIFFGILLFIVPIVSCNLPALDRTQLDIATIRLITSLFSNDSIYYIGGEVRGLQGTGLKLRATIQNIDSSIQSQEFRELTSNGSFVFLKNFPKDSPYTVYIETQPSNPTQICEVGGATGIVGQNSESSVLVQCGENLDVAMPTFSPPPGEYSTETHVVLASSSANSSIYYTIDGTDPSCAGIGTLYSTPVILTQPTLPAISIKAIACVEDRVSSIQIGNFSVTNGQLAIPTVNVPPSGAAYTTAQNVTLSPPAGATVHYTTNGSTPTCASPSTPNPVSVASSLTIHAISCQADWTPSSVASFFYNITGTVAPVSFSQGSNTFNNDVSLSLSTVTSGASIRYVLLTGGDPGTPDCSTSTLYTGPILLNTNNTQIRAIGCLTDWLPSAVSNLEIYNFQVASPGFSPIAGTLSANTNITGTTTTTGAIVHLAEATAPACGGATNVNLSISGDSTELTKEVHAIACKSGYTNSATQVASYTMTGTISPVTFGTPSGAYGGSANTTILPGAVFPTGGFIRYTTDGSDPTCTTGTAYTIGDSVTIPSSLTIKAIACKTSPAWTASSIASATYSITGIVADPSFVPGTGSFIIPISVTISTATAGAHIQYSLNTAITDCSQGTNLASGGTVNITVTGTTLYAIGCKSGDADSAVISATYTLKPNTPTASVTPGTYQTSQTINFSSSSGASIYYTLDGSDPSCAPAGTPGTSVTLNPFQGAVTVKAIACRTDFTPSALFTGVYQMNGQITAPTWNYSNDATNTLTGTLNSPPIVTSQKLCYRVDADPQCSSTNGGTADSLGGECALDSTAYVNPLTVLSSGSYRAIACSANHLSSAVQVQNVTLSESVGNVMITPGTGTVTNDPNVTMTANNSTAIYYRTDGTNPNCSGTDGSTLYPADGFIQSPVGVGTTQIRAIGCAPGFTPSATVISATYTYDTAAPTFSLATGTYFTNQILAINTTTTGTDIYYRVDGTAPTCGVSGGNFLYSGAITLPTDTNFVNLDGVIQSPAFRAIACKTNYNPTIATAPEYFFNVDSFTVSVGGMLYVDSATTLKNDTIGPTTLQLATPNPPGAVFCYRNDGTEPGCSKTDGGTASNSGDFCASGSTLASLNVITAASTGNYVARGCKLGYKHSAPKTLNLTVPEFHPRIFVSNTAVLGGTSVVDADAVCNADINRPFQKPQANYRAFRMGGGRTLTSNWVLEGNTTYYNLANKPIATTNATGSRFGADGSGDIALANQVTTATGNAWTGMQFNSTTSEFEIFGQVCNNWTSSINTLAGSTGNGTATDNTFINAFNRLCSATSKLYCVEQNPRKRIFITSNGKAIGTDFSGKALADAECNDPADPRKPTTGSYKALLRFSDRTHPSTDWVLKPETTYYQTDRTTVIGTTNAASIFATNFTNKISTTVSEQTFLGFGNGWTPSANNCDDYTNSAGTGGGGANAHMTILDASNFFGFTAPCNFNNYRIICVEQ